VGHELIERLDADPAAEAVFEQQQRTLVRPGERAFQIVHS
jgi:hypothetical protein